MKIIQCSTEDAPALAFLNKHLIEDEKSDNPMNLEELENRMKGFLAGEHSAYFFLEDETVIGYALIRQTSSPLYLRQFYIDRPYRHRHCGTHAFRALLAYLQTETIDLDVLPWNEAGRKFWKSLGFTETCISMRYTAQEKTEERKGE